MKSDAFVEKVQKAAIEHGGLSMLVGFVGDAKEEDDLRLYLRPELDWYVEFATDAVVHREPLPADASMIGGSMLWVVPGTKLSHVTEGPMAQQASFLRGDIIGSAAGGTGADSQAAAALPATVTFSSLPCATVVVTVTVTIASYMICTTSKNTPVLTSALDPKGCGNANVTTGPTVICHPQTETMGTWGSVGCGGGGDVPDKPGPGPMA